MLKVNAMSQAHLIRALLVGDMTLSELAEETGLHYVTVREYCSALHKAGAAHIARWEPDARGRHIIKVYRLGQGKDAVRPKMTQSERQARLRARKRAAEMLSVTAGQAAYVQAGNGRLRYEAV